jgi:hypothetical protein
MKKIIFITLVILTLTSCKDATKAQYNALGKPHIIKQYSGGKLIGEWVSTGNVSNEESSDGWYFEDATTGKLIEVTGDIQISVQ